MKQVDLTLFESHIMLGHESLLDAWPVCTVPAVNLN